MQWKAVWGEHRGPYFTGLVFPYHGSCSLLPLWFSGPMITCHKPPSHSHAEAGLPKQCSRVGESMHQLEKNCLLISLVLKMLSKM